MRLSDDNFEFVIVLLEHFVCFYINCCRQYHYSFGYCL